MNHKPHVIPEGYCWVPGFWRKTGDSRIWVEGHLRRTRWVKTEKS